MFSIYDGREHFYQWDLDRKLIVNDETIKQVHFCNKTDECSLVCEVYTEGNLRLVNVPNILLQDNWRINAYGYDESYTKHEKRFDVKSRSKPSVYIYTETEIKSFDALDKRMNELESTVTKESIGELVADYLEENPVEAGATAEEAAQIKQNTADIEALEKLSNDYALKTEIPSIDGLATETFVNDAIGAIEFPETDLSNYYTKQETETEINKAKPDLSPYAKKEDIPSLNGYATEDFVNQQIEAIPEVDLSNYPTKEETNSAIGKVDTKVETLREVVSKFHSNIITEARGEVITINDSSDMELEGLCVYGKSVQDGVPTPDNPVAIVSAGDGGSLGVTVCGKNLIPYPYADGMYKENVNGVSYTVRDDGGISCSGTPTANSSFILYRGKPFKKKITLSIGGTIKNMSARIVMHTSETVDTYTHTIQCPIGKSVTVDFSQYPDIKRIAVGIWRGSPGQEISGIAYVQVESGENSTPYTMPAVHQPLTIQKPEKVPVFLPGILVTSGGNYTDENGQQWVCDEVDFASGKYVQRIGVIDLASISYTYNNNFWRCNTPTGVVVVPTTSVPTAMCSTLKVMSWRDIASTDIAIAWTNEVIIANGSDTVPPTGMLYYKLINHIEHDLTEEQLAQYAALHTNYPNTTIFTDSNAGLKVNYIADTKLYIDNKFNELATALVAN